MTRNRKKHTPKISTFSANLPVNQNQQATDSRAEQVEAVKEFSATTTVSNPYQALPATGLSRIITKKLPEDMDGIVQYYNHIDAIQATSFVEKCRILAHANSLFRDPETKKEFKQEEGTWKDFLAKIGMSQPQVSRFISFWNTFGPKILEKTLEQDFSATKLAELLSWPEDPKVALLENKKYSTAQGDKTVYEMTREELREVKKRLIDLQSKNVIEGSPVRENPQKIQIRFKDPKDPIFLGLKELAKKQRLNEEEIIRKAIKMYLDNF